MKRIQTARELSREILKAFYFGLYRKDDKLMTYKEAQETYGLSKDTIARAYAMLRRDGFIHTDGANGTVVTFDAGNPAHLEKVPLEWPNADSQDTASYKVAMQLHANALRTGLTHSNETQLGACRALVEDILTRINRDAPYFEQVFEFWTCAIAALDNVFLCRITDHFIRRYLYLLPWAQRSPHQRRLLCDSALEYYSFLLDAMDCRNFEEFPARFERHYHHYYQCGGIVFSKLEDGAIFKEQALYERLLEDLCIKIMSGEFQKGDSLPTTKRLCAEYGVSTTTAIRAYGILAEMGFISRRARSGTKLVADLRDAALWERLEVAAGFHQRDWTDAVEALIILSDALCRYLVIAPDVVRQMHAELATQAGLFERYAAPFSVSAVLLSPVIAGLPVGILHRYYVQLTDAVNKIITLCTLRISGDRAHGKEIYRLMCDALNALEQGDQASFSALSERAMRRNFELLTEDYALAPRRAASNDGAAGYAKLARHETG